MRALVGRLWSPAGILLTGGHADLTWQRDRTGRSETVLAADDYRSRGGNGQPPGLQIDPQPFAIAAVVLLLAGAAAALPPIRELRAIGAGAAAWRKRVGPRR